MTNRLKFSFKIKLKKIATKFQENIIADKTIDLEGKSIVSAGWIDGHTHCYDDMELYGGMIR